MTSLSNITSILLKKKKRQSPIHLTHPQRDPTKTLRRASSSQAWGQSGIKVATRLMGSALSAPLLCSWQEAPTNPDPWLLQALLYLRERRGRAVDMQGLPAAMSCVRPATARGGCVRGGMHRYLVFPLSCTVRTVQNRTRMAGHSRPPGGPDHLPRPLAQEKKMAHPPSWSLCSPSVNAIILMATLSRWKGLERWPREHRVSTEPTGLRPSPQ